MIIISNKVSVHIFLVRCSKCSVTTHSRKCCVLFSVELVDCFDHTRMCMHSDTGHKFHWWKFSIRIIELVLLNNDDDADDDDDDNVGGQARRIAYHLNTMYLNGLNWVFVLSVDAAVHTHRTFNASRSVSSRTRPTGKIDAAPNILPWWTMWSLHCVLFHKEIIILSYAVLPLTRTGLVHCSDYYLIVLY